MPGPRRRSWRGIEALALAAGLCANSAVAEPRVFSLDQCADQYVLALARRDSIVGLSTRADDPDSWFRERAKGLPLRRSTLESLTTARPTVVVRYWGGDARLVRALEQRHIKTVRIEEADDAAGVRRNIRTVAAALDRTQAGEALVRDLDGRLARSRGAWKGRPALYYTPSGFTAGAGTLVDEMFKSAGLTNVTTKPGYAPVSLERMILHPPALFVLGFFEDKRGNAWGAGRHPVVQRLSQGRVAARLPGSLLSCPTWLIGEGAERLAKAAPRS
jgi:iron complex transport system substrate-binding protein